MIETLVSNSNGVSLKTHSLAVQKIAVIMAERLGLPIDIQNAISKAALLHDIGKSYIPFQNYVSKKVVSEEFTNNKIFHHEISWAILRYLMNIDKDYNYSILYSIYWHHSRDMSNKNKEYASSILEKLTDDDKQRVLTVYNELTGENKVLSDLDVNIMNDKIPDYYINKDDKICSLNIIVMSCVVSSDRYVSSINIDQNKILIDDNYCNEIVDSIDYSPTKNYITPKNYDIDRFNYQLSCAGDINSNQTSELKAPAGYGKTINGLLAWIKSGNRKLIWVCPRNTIAETLFDGVKNELNALSINNISVELFLTGERRDIYNENNNIDFTSDIIITNIDNFLTPTINNFVRDRMYSLLSSYVIFDEFHELVASEPYFACFVNIMNVRHRYTNSKTLLMSATPTMMTNLWDNSIKGTAILPNETNHYNAAHSKKFRINFLDDITLVNPQLNSLFITNSIKSSQTKTIDDDYSVIAHSKYMIDDRKCIIDSIFDMYGKNKKIQNKLDVISAPLIQAAMDLSFGIMTEIPKSPEDTFQRLGRLNRWGEYDVVDYNILVNINDKKINLSELASINLTYDIKLNKLWIDYLKNNIIDKYEYTLDELYIKYNVFNSMYKKEINEYINDRYIKSRESLSKLFPRKYINKDTKKIVSSGSKLRDNGSNNIYCIYKIYNTDEYTDVFSIDSNGSDMDKHEDNTTQTNQIRSIKKLLTDSRFEYNKHRLLTGNKFTSNKLFESAKNPKTPYICYHKEYHPKLGLISIYLL